MKTWPTETETIEKYLLGKLPVGDRLLFKAKLMLDPVLRVNLLLQQKTYALVRLYGRRKMKEELEQVHQRLFRDPAKKEFQQEINNIFS